MNLGIISLDDQSGYNLIRLLSNHDIEANLIEESMIQKLTHIIIIGKSTDQVLPIWITTGNYKVMGIGGGMEMIAKTFGSVQQSIVEKKQIETNEIKAGKQHLNKRFFNRKQRIKQINDCFVVTGVDINNFIVSFTDCQRWFGYQYRPDKDKYVDIDIFKSFLYPKSYHRHRKKF